MSVKSATQKSLLSNISEQTKLLYTNAKFSFINTSYRVDNFVRNNFFNFVSCTIIGGAYFFATLEFASNCLITFIIVKVVSKIFYFVFSPIRKIKSAPKVKKVAIPKHDSLKWLKEFKSKSSLDRKKMLQQISKQTLDNVANLGVDKAFNFSKEELDTMKQKTQILGSTVSSKYREERYFKIAQEKNSVQTATYLMKVEVIQGDSFDVAIRLKSERNYKNVAVLNMAKLYPGGNFLKGEENQEANLCMRSTLFDSINIYRINYRNYNSYLRKKMGWRYKIPEFGVIYSPKIKVFRGNVNEGFCYYGNPAQINVISSQAYKLKDSANKPSNYREKIKRKLQMILNAALLTNQELVVLGAFGCGEDNNDPKEIVQITKEILKERPIYQQKMKIIFAVIPDSSDRKGNLEAFSDLNGFVK